MAEHHHSHSSGTLPQEPDQEHLAAVADLLGLFADKTRVRILYELLREELCVSDIAQHLGMSASAISHQLRLLKQADLVTSRREGKTMVYSLADDHVKTIIYMAKEHLEEE